MVTFSDKELMLIAIALEEEHENECKRKWVHEAWKNRDNEGEYATLFKELMDDGTKFFQYFRMSESTFNLLLSKVAVHLKKKNTHLRKAISPKERLAVCLRYLVTGDSFQTISFKFRMGLSTVHSIVMETCKVICENLMSSMLPKPTENTWKSIANEFYELWNFPNCLGAMDGKQITIQTNLNTGSSHKKTYSIVLLALVDAHNNIVAVDVGPYDKNSDGEIFANLNLLKDIENGTLPIPCNAALPNTSIKLPYVIVADETFPLKSYLMRPYPEQNLDTSKKIYNYHLSQARRVAENTFRVLSQQFRIYNRIQAAPHIIDYIVLTTCILHNFIKKYDGNNYTFERYEDNEITEGTLETLPLKLENNSSNNAFNVRESFKDYFNSFVGSVPLQEQFN